MTTHWLAVAVPTPAHSGLGEPLTYRAEAPLPPGSIVRVPLGAREVLGEFAGAAPEESTAGGTSDARFIAPLGAECIEVGPVNASIHKVDENVSVADLEALPMLYRSLIERLLA